MTKKEKIDIALIGILIILFGLSVFSNSGNGKNLLGEAGQGVQATVATSSTIVVGIQSVATLFTSNSVCASRIISTVAQPIMLSFNSEITPTALVGHVQAASTTVMYDSGTYGCSTVTAYGFNASSTITKSETR